MKLGRIGKYCEDSICSIMMYCTVVNKQCDVLFENPLIQTIVKQKNNISIWKRNVTELDQKWISQIHEMIYNASPGVDKRGDGVGHQV